LAADRPKSALPLELFPSDIAVAAKYKSATLATPAIDITHEFKMPSVETKPRTLYDKVFADHIVNEQEDGTCLLYIGMTIVFSPYHWQGSHCLTVECEQIVTLSTR
jgi:hypothetical protein